MVITSCRVVKNFKYDFSFCREITVQVPDTVMSITGRGGYHWYYRSDREVGSRTGIIEGVDLRGNGGYVVAPGSIHANGNRYEFEQDFNDIQIADATQEIYDFLEQKEEKESEQFTLPDTIPQGMRNATFYKLACSLQAKGLSDDIITDVVMKEAEKRAVPSMNSDDFVELEKTIKSKVKFRDF